MYASVEPSQRTRKMPEEHPRKPGTPGRLSRMAVTTETVMALSRWADEIGLYRAIHRSTHSGKTIEGRLPFLRHAARYFEALGIAPQDVTRDHLMAYFDIEDERRRGAGPVVHWCNLRYLAIGHAAAVLDEPDPDRVLVLCTKPAKASQHSHWLAARWLWMSRPRWPRTSASACASARSCPHGQFWHSSARPRWRSG
jgi:hypothetical protein